MLTTPCSQGHLFLRRGARTVTEAEGPEGEKDVGATRSSARTRQGRPVPRQGNTTQAVKPPSTAMRGVGPLGGRSFCGAVRQAPDGRDCGMQATPGETAAAPGSPVPMAHCTGKMGRALCCSVSQDCTSRSVQTRLPKTTHLLSHGSGGWKSGIEAPPRPGGLWRP